MNPSSLLPRRAGLPAVIRALAASGLCLVAGASVAATGIQVGATGKTYASSAMSCALHPVAGMAPMVQAGLYNPAKRATATVQLNGVALATVTFAAPDTTVWLTPGLDTVKVVINRHTTDAYVFDATLAFPGQPNVCIPDTRNNSIAGDLEYAASGKSYATIPPGCALNPATGRAQPFVNLFDNGGYLLNVSLNNTPLTQMSATRPRAVAFLVAGLNVISAANGALSTDYYVRDGGSGTCTLP